MTKLSLDDILNSPEFGALPELKKENTKPIKTDEDRLIESFEEINLFVEQNGREPSNNSMTEINLASRLDNFKDNNSQKIILKPYDKFNILGEVEMSVPSIDAILSSDTFDLLSSDADLSIHTFKHVSKQQKRAEADYISKREKMAEEDFEKYEMMFQQVHRELKNGKRKLLPFRDAEKNLIEGNFYLVDGLLAYLEVSKAEKVLKANKSGDRLRLEGRTVTIFENGTISNMLFRSLGKSIQKNGKLVTNTEENTEKELRKNAGIISKEDKGSGWIYVLKSKSDNPKIARIKNLHKIGFSTTPVNDRIKNAQNEATYLFADVEIVATWHCYNMNAQKFESLVHRFFAEVCLNVDIFDRNNQRITPREWFIVPLKVINEVIDLIDSGDIINYRYNMEMQHIAKNKITN